MLRCAVLTDPNDLFPGGPLVLCLPDELVFLDAQEGHAERVTYELCTEAEFEAGVRHALDAFARGDLFEVVLSQTFQATTDVRPSDLFTSLRALNPAPCGFIMNLGAGELLVGASPEMFVRVRGRVVETC